MKILIIGTGFLGSKIYDVLSKEYKVVGTYFKNPKAGCRKLDITIAKDVKNLINKEKPDILIHTAAMVDINYCESNRREAWLVNVEGTEHLACICKAKKIKMFYISTDYVFSGEDSPYSEKKKAHPINYYGLTKLKAEELVKRLLSDYCIIRPTILYGYNDGRDKSTFVTQILSNLKAKKKMIIDNYRIKYPILIDDVANGFLWLLKGSKKGIFHFSSHQPITRYQWALKIAEIFGYPKILLGGDVLDKEKKPPRPYKVKLINTRAKVKFAKIETGLRIIKSQMAL